MAKRTIPTNRPSSIYCAATGAALLVVACAAGCSGTQPASETLVSVTSALTAVQQQILGFESPATDWSSPTGALGRTSTHSQGSFSTSVLNNGWTEIISKPIASLGPVSTMLTYDLRLPQAMPWGETRVIIRVPSQSIFWQDLGSVPLVSTPAGVFERITFALPPALVTALSASYTDLEIHVVINAPNSTTPFLLDNLAIAPAAPSGGSGGSSGSALSFSVTTPSGVGPADMFMSTTSRLQVDDRVVLGTSSALESVANFGSAGFELGAQAVAHANVYSAGGTTFLRSQSTVGGFVRAVGTIQTQPPVTIGSQQPNTATASTPTLFTVTPPATTQPFLFLDVDLPPAGQPPRAIAPGAYAGLDVHSRSRVSLTTGTYFFDSFNTEPDAQVFIDTSAGPIFIYTKTMFRFHGGFVQSAGAEGRVLVGHSGTSNVDLQVGFVGTVVAPNAQIDLRRPTTGQHKGSFFGARIEAFSDSTILHIPFDWSFLCARGDSDGDGLTDCDDACPNDPKKSQPGTCGCGVAETDSDGDGTPDCIEGCPNDPTNVACAHSNDPPSGTSGLPVTNSPPPVDQSTCNSPLLFPPQVRIPLDPSQVTQAQKDEIASDACSLINDTTATNGVACSGPTQDPAECPLDPNSVKDGPCIDPPPTSTRPTRADLNAACVQKFGPGFICAVGQSTVCLGPNPPADQCQTAQFHCGTPDPACATPEGDPAGTPPCTTPSGPAGSCTEIALCGDLGSSGPSGPSDPTAYKLSPAVTTTSIASNQQVQTLVYSDPPNQPGCPIDISGDCWCTLSFKQPTAISDVQSKPATHGSGSIVQLQSTPNVQFDINPNPLPFGESQFSADASASYKATVTFTLAPFGSASTDLVDLAAGVHASRCSLSTDGTRFFILGKDFIDFSDAGSEPFNTQSADNPALQAGQDCFTALGGYVDASDRAKRALKDAQELIQAYQTLPANTSFVKSHSTPPLGFCDVADNQNHDPGFPQGNCLSEPIAQTVNRYVDYYNDARIPALNTAMKSLTAKTAGLQQALNQIGTKITFLNETRNDMVNVVNQQFFVGPIPVNITVDVGVFYGIEGDLFYRYTPFSALALADNTPSQMAAIGGELLPRVGAMLEIFAGVGFDIPGFAVKAGIAGDLTLVEVEANLQAGVGLAVATHADPRPIPPPLDTLGTGALYFPTRKYEYFTDWFYDASVAVPEILEGTINAKVKLKALFFSKTFTKTLLTFGPAFSIPSTTLLHGGGALSGLDLPVPGVASNSLKPFEMQEPMVQLRRLAVPAADPTTTQPFAQLPSVLHYEGNCNLASPL